MRSGAKLRPWGGGSRRQEKSRGGYDAASETVSLSRVSRWRKVGVGPGAASVSVCKDCSACLLRAGVWLSRDWALVAPRGQLEEVSEGKCLMRVAQRLS